MPYPREELLPKNEVHEKLCKLVAGEKIEHRGDYQWFSQPFKRPDLSKNEEVYIVSLCSKERETNQTFLGVRFRENQPTLTNPTGEDVTDIRWFEIRID